MTYKEKPANFNPKFEIVSCFVEYRGKILLLHRHDGKSQGNRWGLPAGKVEKGENITKAVLREIKEETSIDIPESEISYFGRTYHHHGDYDFTFHMFSAKLNYKPQVTINPGEHKDFTWKKPQEAVAIKKDEIVEDFDDVCKLFYKL